MLSSVTECYLLDNKSITFLIRLGFCPRLPNVEESNVNIGRAKQQLTSIQLNFAYQHPQFSHLSSPGHQLAVQTAATTIRTAFAVVVVILVMF